MRHDEGQPSAREISFAFDLHINSTLRIYVMSSRILTVCLKKCHNDNNDDTSPKMSSINKHRESRLIITIHAALGRTGEAYVN